MIEVLSPQEQKSRINVESMVAFDGVSQYASAGVNQNVINAVDYDRDHSFSLFVIVPLLPLNDIESGIIFTMWNDLEGLSLRVVNTSSLGYTLGIYYYNENGDRQRSYLFNYEGYSEKLVHIVVNYTASTQNWQAIFNTVLQEHTVNQSELLNSSIYAGNIKNLEFARNPLLWAGSPDLNNREPQYGKPFLSHLAFFNRTLTQQEINYIHAQGGLLPASTHANCVAHYPCTQREGNTLFDVVEQYNYVKDRGLLINSESIGDDFTLSLWARDYQASVIFNGLENIIEVECLNNAGTDSFDFITLLINLPAGYVKNKIGNNSQYNYSLSFEIMGINANGGSVKCSIDSPDVPNFFDMPSTWSNRGPYIGKLAYDRIALKFRPSINTGDKFLIRNVVLIPENNQLLPYHATLQNFTPDQHTGGSQSAYKEFYDKVDHRPFSGFIDFEGATNKGYQFGDLARYSTNFSVRLYIKTGSTFPDVTPFSRWDNSVGNALQYLIKINNNSRLRFLLWDGGSVKETYIDKPALLQANTWYEIVCTHSGTRQEIYINGVNGRTIQGATFSGGSFSVNYNQPSILTVGCQNTSGNFGVNGSLGRVDVFNRVLTQKEVIDKTAKDIVESYQLQADGSMKEVISNTTGTPINLTISSVKQGEIEVSSLLPPLRKALRFDSTNLQRANISGISPTGELGYTFVFSVQSDLFQPDTYYTVMSKRSDVNPYNSGATGQNYLVIRFYNRMLQVYLQQINSGGYKYFFDMPDWVDFSKVNLFEVYVNSGDSMKFRLRINGNYTFIPNDVNVGFVMSTLDNLDRDVEIGRNSTTHYFDGNILMAGIVKGKLSYKQSIQLWNNSLLNSYNPFGDIDWILMLNFNQATDNAGTYEIENLGSAGGNAVLNGYDSGSEATVPIDAFRFLDDNNAFVPQTLNTRFGANAFFNTTQIPLSKLKFSISLWIYRNADNANKPTDNVIFIRLNSGGYLRMNFNNNLSLAFSHTGDGNSNPERTVLSPTNVGYGAWHHLVITFEDGVSCKAYSNKTVSTTTSNVTLSGDITNFGILGSFDNNEGPLDGYFRNFQVYNDYILNQTEVDQIFDLGHQAIAPPISIDKYCTVSVPFQQKKDTLPRCLKTGLIMELSSGDANRFDSIP